MFDTSNSGLPGNFIKSIAIDGSGNKWIGTDGGGLAKFDNRNWTVYDTLISDLPNNRVVSIAIDSTGNKWIGTRDGGLAKFNGKNWTVYDTSNSGLPDNYVKSITIDSSGNKWIGTYVSGLAKFNGSNWIVYDISNSGLSSNYVKSIAIDKVGNKWIGTMGGLTVYNEGGIIIPIKDIKNPIPQKQFKIKFNQTFPITRISYTIPKSCNIVLKVFDIKGRVLKTLVNGYRKAGTHHVQFNHSSLSNGTYLIHLQSEEKMAVTKKIVLLK